MAANNEELTRIDFNRDWQCYQQTAEDRTDDKQIVSSCLNDYDNDSKWKAVELPHLLQSKQRDRSNSTKYVKWWYRKKFQWLSTNNQESDQKIYLRFESTNEHENVSRPSDIQVIIWLNGKQIAKGPILAHCDSIELRSEYLHRSESDASEGSPTNVITVCCVNSSLCADISLMVHGKMICATGKIKYDEPNPSLGKTQDDILNYTVSMDDDDGRIGVSFNPKIKEKLRSLFSSSPSASTNDQDRIPSPEHADEDLLVPRLAIVILIVGTRGDVQPFIALGQALRSAGHRVRLATHETFRSFVRGNGLEFFPLAGDPADLMAFMVKNSGIIPSMSSIIEGDISRKRRSLADILASTWQACIAPDDETNLPFTAEAIIANPPSFGHIHCAEKLQIPLHIIFTMPWSPTSAFPHPLSNIDNSIGPKDKINLYSYDVIEMLTWTGMRDIINNFRKKILDLSVLHTRQAIHALIDERVPHTYCWSPSIVSKPHDWGSHIDVSGFFFLDLGTAYTNPPQDLLNFLGIGRDNEKDRKLSPPIYIGFGSITGHDSRRILDVVVNAIQRTGYRALLSGLASDTDQLPDNIFKIGNVPHDWLFQHVSAVCHHGGAGTTAAGLRAGKPTIIVPFFGDQFFWGNVVEKSGAGSKPLPGKSITADQLAEAFNFVHKSTTRAAAERIRDGILRENGCAAAVHSFHANLPLKRLHSDLEPTFAACFYLEKYGIQISRPVAQVLIGAGAMDESELGQHVSREWKYGHDDRVHVLTHGIVEHSEKAFTSMFMDTAAELKRIASNTDPAKRTLEGAGSVAKGVGLGIGHLSIGCLSLYGEVTDALDLATALYDPYSDSGPRPRPRVTDFKSGAKAAGLALWNGWKDGITGIITHPQKGYARHGVIGGAAATLIATVNIAVKPSVGTLSSLTWLSRGTYASVKKAIDTYGKEGRRISPNLFDTSSEASNQQSDGKDDQEVTPQIKKAASLSGFHPKVCQHILNEFEKIKAEARIPPPSKKNPIADFFSGNKKSSKT